MRSPRSCIDKGPTSSEKYWDYYEYYVGEKDEEERRHGQGENYWSGAKSLESYNGALTRDTMHGSGAYRWQFYGPAGTFQTYEGYFYANKMHGYGVMSHDDGRIFEGLFYNDVRFGPGVQSYVNLKVDVGLWQKNQLVRLTWKPPSLSMVPNFLSNPYSRLAIRTHRKLLTKTHRKIGEVNSAIEVLKQSGCTPRGAAKKWTELYPSHCTDVKSKLCHVDLFDKSYYINQCQTLQDCQQRPQEALFSGEHSATPSENIEKEEIVYAWNNNEKISNIMKHCYQHDSQRKFTKINLSDILSGPRNRFRPAGKYEILCRSMLMMCYLKRTLRVAHYILEYNIHPDISDVLGNTAMMYAACGDQPETIHFLAQCRANIDGMNDSCCTPLAVTLLRYACTQKDIPTMRLLEATVPPLSTTVVPLEDNVSEWLISREVGDEKLDSTTKPSPIIKKTKSAVTQSGSVSQIYPDTDDENDEVINEHYNIRSEYTAKLNNLYLDMNNMISNPKSNGYLYNVRDMVFEIDLIEEEIKKAADTKSINKRNVSGKIVKEVKPSKDQMFQDIAEEIYSINSATRLKSEAIQRIQSTITQLLTDGADPKLARFPQPALFTAVISGCPEVTKQLIEYGADINERYPDALRYTPLEVAVSQRFTSESVEIIRILLENGADASRRLEPKMSEVTSTDDTRNYDVLGPTLLHAVILRKIDKEVEEEKRLEVINLLLQHNCNPLVQYSGASALDLSMTKGIDIFNTMIRHPATDLNAVINSSNQTILVKMLTPSFYKSLGAERTQMLTYLLLHGADPLRPCQNEGNVYENLFVFAKNTVGSLSTVAPKQSQAEIRNSPSKLAVDPKKRKEESKPKKDDKSKQATKTAADDVTDCKEALKLITSCARMLHVRWLQAKIFEELAEVVFKYKHRTWNMIIGEHKHKKSLSIWLTAQRGLEIWDMLSKTNKKIYNDNTVIKYTLYIIYFYEIAQTLHKLRVPYMTASEKDKVESYVNGLFREYKLQKPTETNDVKSLYVMPELTSKYDKRFNVCFECALPRTVNMIMCKKCKRVYFCTEECIIANCVQGSLHPCYEYLVSIYGLSAENDGTGLEQQTSETKEAQLEPTTATT